MTRFGVQLPSFSGIDPVDLFEHVAGLVTAAEEAGFDSVWVMDHFYQLPPLGVPDAPMLEAYVTVPPPVLLGARDHLSGERRPRNPAPRRSPATRRR